MRMTVAAYAKLRSVTRRTVINWIHRGLLRTERLGTGRTEPWTIVAEQFGYGRTFAMLDELHVQVQEQRDHLNHIQAVLDASDQVPHRTPPGIQPPTEPLRYVDLDDLEQPPPGEEDVIDEQLARASRAIDNTFTELQRRRQRW